MNHSLNNEEVAKISGKCITMIPYIDICMYSNIEDIFATNYVLINYLSSDTYGHWVGLHLSECGDTISFFDSYGKLPDSQLEYIPIKYRIESNQDYPYLVSLMDKWINEDASRSIHYNNEQFQKYSSKITTCGRWVGYYLRFSDSCTIEEFEDIFNEMRDKYFLTHKPKSIDRDMFFDNLIVYLTNSLLLQ